MKAFRGISVGQYLLIRLADGKIIAYSENENFFKKVAPNPSFTQVFGSCYVTINATHFIQIGGYRNETAIGQVFLVEIIPQLKAAQYKEQLYMKFSKLPKLNFQRKYHGCGKGMISNDLSIIVAGGIGINNTTLKSVEYLPLKLHDIRGSSTNSDSVIFKESPRKIAPTQKSTALQKYHTFLASEEKSVEPTKIGIEDSAKSTFDNEWMSLPPMKIARSYFPTIIASNGTLSIVGGDCTPMDRKYCKLVESFDKDTCNWQHDTLRLKSIRYNHNSAEIPLLFCHTYKSNPIVKDGFVVGS